MILAGVPSAFSTGGGLKSRAKGLGGLSTLGALSGGSLPSPLEGENRFMLDLLSLGAMKCANKFAM